MFLHNIVQSLFGRKSQRADLTDDGYLKCLECGSNQWLEGPEGGSGQNIKCENSHLFVHVPGTSIMIPVEP